MTPERRDEGQSYDAAPVQVWDRSGAPRFGTYQGELKSARLSGLQGEYALNAPLRAVRHKRWQYQLFSTNEVIALFAVADLSYTSNAFAVVVDLQSRKALCDVSLLGAPRSPLAFVNDEPSHGLEARFRSPGASFHVNRPAGTERFKFDVSVARIPFVREGMKLHAELLAAGAAPALTVIAPVENGGVVNVTQKWSSLLAFGQLSCGSKSFSLDGGVGGMDYTQGYLARRTKWRWGFAAGRLPSGDPIGFNLVEGFNEGRADVNENAVWVGGQLHPVGRVRFLWNDADLFDRWRVESEDGTLKLSFRPFHVHREHRDLKVVKSDFAQPIGLFDGTIELSGRTYEVKDLAGVTEDQDIVW